MTVGGGGSLSSVGQAIIAVAGATFGGGTLTVSGTVLGGLTPDERISHIPAETRVAVIESDLRLTVVGLALRLFAVDAEGRRRTIPAESRRQEVHP